MKKSKRFEWLDTSGPYAYVVYAQSEGEAREALGKWMRKTGDDDPEATLRGLDHVKVYTIRARAPRTRR